MDERVYKGRLLTFVKELVLLFFAALLIVMLLSLFLEMKYSLGIVVVLVGIFIFLKINDVRQTVIVTNESVTFQKGAKKECYEIEQCQFRARSSNNGCYLYVIDVEGKEHRYDVSMLGYRQFQSCIEDIGIVGEKAKPIRLEVKGGKKNGTDH
ncbi:hypothetical protein [Filifactor villosus]|uniref:Uncharacterized protein n=1 Tax=Filifactor villosus TaxID=29374 RepID=A0ABV9QPG5_9FIRM